MSKFNDIYSYCALGTLADRFRKMQRYWKRLVVFFFSFFCGFFGFPTITLSTQTSSWVLKDDLLPFCCYETPTMVIFCPPPCKRRLKTFRNKSLAVLCAVGAIAMASVSSSVYSYLSMCSSPHTRVSGARRARSVRTAPTISAFVRPRSCQRGRVGNAT